MDGRGTLLRAFCDTLGLRAEVVAYPSDRVLDYEALEALVRARLVHDEPTLLVAESFSGPLAIRIAASPPPCLRGLVLVGTFAAPPAPRILRLGIGPGMFVFPIPRAIVRALMVDAGAPRAAVDEVRDVVGEVNPFVLAHRMREVLSVDATDALRRVQLPVLCIEAARDRLLVRRRTLDRARPGLRWETVVGPHLLLAARPTECARIVERFAREVVRDSSRRSASCG